MNDEKVEEVKKTTYEEDFAHYRKTLSYLGANVPIQVLCLPKAIEHILLRDGRLRVYDMIDFDLTKIKGLGERRSELLAARLDEFFTMSI